MSLWQKPESETPQKGAPTQAHAQAQAHTPMMSAPPATRETRSDRVATIGGSVQIKGELGGNEDLTVEGRIEGRIVLADHHLTVGSSGRIQAEVRAKSVLVQGEIHGNITADDRVEIAPSGTVRGDICSPRVVLADGSSFKGSIDMAGPNPATAKPAQNHTAQTHATPAHAATHREPALAGVGGKA
jgi:cytoskeletal protein CcmA (bactofilin family)